MVHGDLSEYNILLAADGPVIIDLPQAVNAAGNNEAPVMLERDVDNLATYFGQFAPELIGTQYGKEIWQLYESGELKPGGDADRPGCRRHPSGRHGCADAGAGGHAARAGRKN